MAHGFSLGGVEFSIDSSPSLLKRWATHAIQPVNATPTKHEFRVTRPLVSFGVGSSVRAASEPRAPARGLVPPLARWALTRSRGSGRAGCDNPKIRV